LTGGLPRLNSLLSLEAQAALQKCCGSSTWARRMAELRPFRTTGQLLEAADRVWSGLGREDWLEAFSGHPRIGEKTSVHERSQGHWSSDEQAGTLGAPTHILEELGKANQAYEARFGYTFIVCATGKRAEEMLALLKQRLENDPGIEVLVAVEEQRRITRLRLEKLLLGE
jgi:OHCU decarboxylase